MIGRETSFRYSKVPADFKFGHSRRKTGIPRLSQDQVEGIMMKMRSSIDGASFTKSRMWEDFMVKVELVYDVLADKLESMKKAVGG